MNQTYRSVIAKNSSYINAGQTSAMTWHELSELKSAQSGSPRIATYASFPGTAQTSVTYYVDGKAVTTLTKAPYYYTLNISGMTSGEHTVYASAKSGQFTRTTETYTINVSGGQWNWVEAKAPETTEEPITASEPETTGEPGTNELIDDTSALDTTAEADTITDNTTKEDILDTAHTTAEDHITEQAESESLPETTASEDTDGDSTVDPLIIAAAVVAVVVVIAVVTVVSKKKK